MKRIILSAFLVVSTLVGTASFNNQVQAAGIDGDPDDNPRVWLCSYRLHEGLPVVHAEVYNSQVVCPVYTASELSVMSSFKASGKMHMEFVMNNQYDHLCTVEIFGGWG